MSDTQQLVARINALAERTDTSASTLSRKLFGNGNRIAEIAAGGSITMRTYEQALAMLEEMERAA